MNPATPDQLPFWRRQFSPQSSVRQDVFDVAVGIALPLFCLIVDPFVLRSSFGEPLLNGYRGVAISAIGLGFFSLALWLSIRKPSAVLAGLLAGGALFALLLGLVLLPFSAVGLFMVIGILGFSPFATAFVFWRNAVRAFPRPLQGRTAVKVLAVLGLTLASAGPWAAQLYVKHEVSRAFAMIQSDDPTAATHGVAILKRLSVFADFDRLVTQYESEEDQERRARLARMYWELTGSEIEHRLAILRD